MKGLKDRFAIGFILAALNSVVGAQTIDVDASSNSASNSASGSTSGNAFHQTFDSHNQGSEIAPSVIPPSLTTTLSETCMGSTSAGVTVVGVGASLGSTWSDEECVRRLDARQMHMLGDTATAREIMCASELVRAAAIRAGKPCGSNVRNSVAVAPRQQLDEQAVFNQERLRDSRVTAQVAAANLAKVQRLSAERRARWAAEAARLKSAERRALFATEAVAR